MFIEQTPMTPDAITDPRRLINPSEGCVLVGPDMALDWLQVFNYEKQRQLRPGHADNLAKEMEAGRFTPKTQIAFCLIDGAYKLVNGQHTLRAIVISGYPQLLSVVIHPVQSEDEIADIFSRYDTHLTRQFADSLFAHAEDVRLGVTKTELNWITAACTYFAFLSGELKFNKTSKLTHDQKLLLIRKHGELSRDTLRTFHEPNKGSTAFCVRKTTLGTAMLIYQHHGEDICRDFYGEMLRDDGLKIGDPRKTLLEAFRTSTTGGGGYSLVRGAKKAIPDHVFVLWQATAFNAYIKRKELRLIRVDFTARSAHFEGIGDVPI